MTLTKKNFEAIAEILHKETFTQADDGFKYVALYPLIDSLTDYFEKENPAFDPQPFEAAVLNGKIGLKNELQLLRSEESIRRRPMCRLLPCFKKGRLHN